MPIDDIVFPNTILTESDLGVGTTPADIVYAITTLTEKAAGIPGGTLSDIVFSDEITIIASSSIPPSYAIYPVIGGNHIFGIK